MPVRKEITRVCLGCGKVECDISRNLVTKYCSRECWRKNGAGQHLKTGKTLTCRQCKKPFYTRGANVLRGAKYCSQSCYILANVEKVIERKCSACNKIFSRSNRPNQKFCSHKCSKTGIHNPNWMPQLTLNLLVRRNLRDWRNDVFRIDGYKCRVCGTKGEGRSPFNAHHLDAYHWCKERRYDVTNGVTLCKFCHGQFHDIYGLRNNTELQFREFLNMISAQHWTVSAPSAQVA
jgi:hypothetical protein